MHILSLILALLSPFLIRWIMRRLRRGKVLDGGTFRVRRDLESNTFKCPVRINGREIEGILDTGASITTIGVDAARKVGIDVSSLFFITDIDTAAGTKQAAMADVTVESLQVGPITVRNLTVGVNRYGGRQCLVGMNFFESLDSFLIEGDLLTLKKGQGSEQIEDAGIGPSAPVYTSEARSRVPAECPHCAASMTLPAGRRGKVKCHACGRPFLADTKTTEDGKARCRTGN